MSVHAVACVRKCSGAAVHYHRAMHARRQLQREAASCALAYGHCPMPQPAPQPWHLGHAMLTCSLPERREVRQSSQCSRQAATSCQRWRSSRYARCAGQGCGTVADLDGGFAVPSRLLVNMQDCARKGLCQPHDPHLEGSAQQLLPHKLGEVRHAAPLVRQVGAACGSSRVGLGGRNCNEAGMAGWAPV